MRAVGNQILFLLLSLFPLSAKEFTATPQKQATDTMKILFEHQNFFHPSVIPYRGKQMLVMHKMLGMDRFTVPYFSFSENNGRDWSEPQEITSLKKFVKCGDFRPIPMPDDRMAGIIGLVSGEKGYRTVYLIYDGEWSEPVEIPGMTHDDDRAACTQIAVDKDGLLTIAFFRKEMVGKFATVTRQYRLEGKRLIHSGSGTPLISTAGRGWYEPSVIWMDGVYYLTLRCDENCALLARSFDGLHWSEPVKWQFSDGSVLETDSTQQHWLKKKDELWLVYTRHDSSNEDCFRWRTPIFAAPFDCEKMTLDKSREIIMIPRRDYRNRPGLMGNFNITNLTDRAYISDTFLWFDWTPDREAIEWFSTSVIMKEITF